MRLWQLLLMCKITRLTQELKPRLKIPLETTQLILVHSAPLTICFNVDEKQFTVEGGHCVIFDI